MKTFLVFLGKALVVLACLAVLLFIGRNFVARKSVEVGVRAVTGFPMSIETVDLASNLGSVDVSNLRLENPQSEYSELHFVTIESMHMEYGVMSVIKGSPDIQDLKMVVPKVSIVRSNQGVYNISKLKGIDRQGEAAAKEGGSTFRLGKLQFSLGSVTIEDFTNDRHTTKTVKIDKTFTAKEMTDPDQIVRAVLLAVLTHVEVPDLKIDMDSLKAGVGQALETVGQGM